ncbi:helix-turn-helix domain-containing protein [Amycolatopsis sp. NPDC059021]|uniref:helix-turn-helix domain-containing protein n=1 Tax=Amycolatopsis sp. NPDC059021 TaxID=3346704 RepID=UPI00366D4BE8
MTTMRNEKDTWMPADHRHLEELFARAAPGKTREQLAEENGIPLNQLNYLFRRESPGLPTWEKLQMVARMLNVPLNDVVLAFAKDQGIDLETGSSKDEQELLSVYRSLSKRDRRAAIAVMHALAESL